MRSLGYVAIPKNGDKAIGTRGHSTIYTSKAKAIWSAAQGFLWVNNRGDYYKAKERALNEFNFHEVFIDD